MTGFFQSLDTAAFPVVLSALYVVGKIAIKWVMRTLARQLYAPIETVSWFAVDMAVLTIGLSLGSDLTRAHSFSMQGSIIWYLVLIGALLVTVFLHGLFLHYKYETLNPRWKPRLCVIVGLFIGFGPFLQTVSLIMEGPAT